jgi:hypothetical protein
LSEARGVVRGLVFPLIFATLATASPAAAFTCALSLDKTAVIVKSSNPNPQPASCTVTCRFTVPEGTASITCSQTIPTGVKDWYVCIRPAAGKNYGAPAGGDETCAKP